MTEEEVKLNYITPAIESAGWQKKANTNGIFNQCWENYC